MIAPTITTIVCFLFISHIEVDNRYKVNHDSHIDYSYEL
jgi:hypothetical protein